MSKITNRYDGSPIALLGLVLTLVIALAIYGNFSPPVSSGVTLLSNTSGIKASGALTWSGDSRCGDMVNITDVNGVKASFYINISDVGGCTQVPAKAGVFSYVNITYGSNTSTWTAQNITIAINGNATLAATMVATNSSAGVTTVTYNTVGPGGNSVATTESSANASWGSSTLLGGADGNNVWNTGTTSLMNNTPTMTTLAYWIIPVIAILFIVRRAT